MGNIRVSDTFWQAPVDLHVSHGTVLGRQAVQDCALHLSSTPLRTRGKLGSAVVCRPVHGLRHADLEMTCWDLCFDLRVVI